MKNIDWTRSKRWPWIKIILKKINASHVLCWNGSSQWNKIQDLVFFIFQIIAQIIETFSIWTASQQRNKSKYLTGQSTPSCSLWFIRRALSNAIVPDMAWNSSAQFTVTVDANSEITLDVCLQFRIQSLLSSPESSRWQEQYYLAHHGAHFHRISSTKPGSGQLFIQGSSPDHSFAMHQNLYYITLYCWRSLRG